MLKVGFIGEKRANPDRNDDEASKNGRGEENCKKKCHGEDPFGRISRRRAVE